MRPHPRWTILALAAALLCAEAGCLRRSDRPDPGIPYASGTASPKLSTFTFKEEGKLYLITVGVNATRFHEKDSFIPVTIMVANKSATPLLLHRESFTLVDPVTGSRYGLASIDEVRRQGKQTYDRQLMDQEHMPAKLDIFHRLPSNFFPFQQLVNDQIELHRASYFLDVIYFPRPEGELLGRTFELHVTGKSVQGDLFVVFTVPES